MIRFKLVNKEPIYVNVMGKNYALPRFRRRDWKEWRAKEMSERTEDATKGMVPEQRARVLLLFPPQPLTTPEMRKRVYTMEGTGHVFRTCAERGGVPAAVIDQIVDDGEVDEMDLETIAVLLASMADPDQVARELGIPKDDKDEPEGDDPLTRAGHGSHASPKTES